MIDKIEALRERADGLDTLLRERNLYKGKYRALLKLISKTRDKLVQVTDHIEDEGDRAYFGSTNHADDLKELYHEMMDWIWDAVDKTNRMQSDPYADIRKQRARADKAEAELDRLRSENEAMRKALEGSHRLFLPIFMQLAEAELVGEPVKGEAVLFSFMGSGASDHVTVGDFRKALEAVRSALSLQEEEAR